MTTRDTDPLAIIARTCYIVCVAQGAHMFDARDNLISLISDLHKDARGFRPGGMYNYDAMSIADMEALCESLSQEEHDRAEADRLWAIELDRQWRDDVALGVVAPDDTVKLEPWEVWEARAESAGFGA